MAASFPTSAIGLIFRYFWLSCREDTCWVVLDRVFREIRGLRLGFLGGGDFGFLFSLTCQDPIDAFTGKMFEFNKNVHSRHILPPFVFRELRLSYSEDSG